MRPKYNKSVFPISVGKRKETRRSKKEIFLGPKAPNLARSPQGRQRLLHGLTEGLILAIFGLEVFAGDGEEREVQ